MGWSAEGRDKCQETMRGRTTCTGQHSTRSAAPCSGSAGVVRAGRARRAATTDSGAEAAQARPPAPAEWRDNGKTGGCLGGQGPAGERASQKTNSVGQAAGSISRTGSRRLL